MSVLKVQELGERLLPLLLPESAAVNVAPVPDPNDQDDEAVVLDPVDDPIVAQADTVEVFDAGELDRRGGTRVASQGEQMLVDPGQDLRGQSPQVLRRGGFEDDPIGH